MEGEPKSAIEIAAEAAAELIAAKEAELANVMKRVHTIEQELAGLRVIVAAANPMTRGRRIEKAPRRPLTADLVYAVMREHPEGLIQAEITLFAQKHPDGEHLRKHQIANAITRLHRKKLIWKDEVRKWRIVKTDAPAGNSEKKPDVPQFTAPAAPRLGHPPVRRY